MRKFTLFLAALMTIMSVNAAAYLKGSFNGWGESNPFTNGKATITLSANATFEFKIHDGDWYGNGGIMDSGNCTDWVFSSDNAPNARITTTIAGEYVFTWNSSTKKVSVTYPTEAVKIDYYIAGTIVAAGWNEKGQKMTENNGLYTYTASNLAAGNYEFKVTNGTWNTTFGFSDLATTYQGVTAGENNNIALNLAETTDLTVTFTGSKISLNLPEKTYTIYFVDQDAWGSVNAYVWTGDPYKSWPGEAMTKIAGKTYKGKDVYEYTYPANYSNVIFNGGGKQTGDLTISEGNFYYYDQKWNASITYDASVEPEPEPEPTTYAVKFDNTNSGWAKVYAYCWNGEGESVVDNAAWPGVELTNPENNVYTYSTTTAYENVIFNAGAEKPQTANLVFENGKTYSIDVAYVLGTINYERIANNECWSVDFAEHKMTYDANTGIWTKAYTNLPAGDYEFKLYCGDWLNSVVVDSVNSTPGFKYDNLGDNISFTLSEAATVTITYNAMLNTFAIVGQGIDKFGELVVTSYTLCGSKAIFGGEKDFDETLTANDMTEQDGVWTKTYEAVQLEAYNEETSEGVTYEYKVAANHVWNGAAYPSADVRMVLWVAEAGKYNLTFTYEPNKAEGEKLTCVVEKVAAEPTTYTLAGDAKIFGTGWCTDCTENDLTEGEDGVWTKTYTVQLEAGDYEYKVVANYAWGNGEFPVQGNEKITITEAGTYNLIFTYIPGETLACQANLLVAPAAPVISIEKGVVTFSCETEGAKIMYAFVEKGGELTDAMYQGYTGEISMSNGDYTVYAYAEKDGLKSEVVSMRLKIDNGVAVDAEVVTIAEIFVQNRTIVTDGEFQIFTVTGQNVTDMNGALANGVDVVRTANAVAKVVVR